MQLNWSNLEKEKARISYNGATEITSIISGTKSFTHKYERNAVKSVLLHTSLTKDDYFFAAVDLHWFSFPL